MIFLAYLFATNLFPVPAQPNDIPTSSSEILIVADQLFSETSEKSNKPNNISEDNILCVEVGWQRIKAAIIPNKVNFEQLKSIQTISSSSTMWLNSSFTELFDKTQSNSPLIPLLEKPFSRISLSISGPVIDNSIHPDHGSRGIPENLKDACEKVAHCDVMVENDILCWAIGVQEYLKLKSKSLKYPYLAITFGTGVGAAIAVDENNIYGIEITYISCPFARLKEVTRDQKFSPFFSPHRALGKPYFDWKLGRKEFTDEQVEPYLINYNIRFLAFMDDIVECLNSLFDTEIKDILIGGGYSRFLQIPDFYSHSIILLKPQNLQAEGISPDIIQLLGCKRLSQANHPKTYLYPTHSKIEQIRTVRTKNNALHNKK